MFKMFKNLNKRQILLLIASIFFIVVQVLLDLKIPDYMQNITVLVQTEGSSISSILKEGGYMLLCAAGSLVAAIVTGYCASNIGTGFAKTIRSKVFDKVSSFGMEEIKKFSTASLITRTTNDITQVQMFLVMAIQMLIKAPIMATIAITKIANKGWEFSLITVIGVLIVIVMIALLIVVVLPKFKKIQTLTDNLNRITRENLTGIRVVKAYNAEEYQLDKFETANEELTSTHLFTQRALSFASPIMSTVMSGLSLSIYWVGALLINEADMMNKMSIFGNMVTFSSYAIQVIMSFVFLAMLFIIYPRASVSAKRLNEVLETESNIKDGFIDKNTTGLKGEIEFRHVSFKYPDAEEYILKDINFKINRGETVAFIGSTGSGKSTLINLIPKFYNVTEGSILIDGIDIKDMTRAYLNDLLGYISQKAILFKGTIEDNITLGTVDGKKPDKMAIEDAVKVSQSSEFIDKLEKGYTSPVAQGGVNFSGGQKQRISIARAIARNPEIYIFDDSFSALDYKTDFTLREALKSHTKDATILIVAQRIGTIKDADKIVVLDDGKCVGIGDHKTLLKTCKVYKEIADSQLSKEELENA